MTTTGTPGFAAALVRLAHLVHTVSADVARSHDLTPQQAQLLVVLLSGPVDMTALSRALHLGRPGTTGLIERVERRGLVTRTRDDADRRAYLAGLTAAGLRLAGRVRDDVVARVDDRTRALPADLREALVAAVADPAAGFAPGPFGEVGAVPLATPGPVQPAPGARAARAGRPGPRH